MNHHMASKAPTLARCPIHGCERSITLHGEPCRRIDSNNMLGTSTHDADWPAFTMTVMSGPITAACVIAVGWWLMAYWHDTFYCMSDQEKIVWRNSAWIHKYGSFALVMMTRLAEAGCSPCYHPCLLNACSTLFHPGCPIIPVQQACAPVLGWGGIKTCVNQIHLIHLYCQDLYSWQVFGGR